MAFEDELRHAKDNEQARRNAAERLRPMARSLLSEAFEIEESEFPEMRDAVKQLMRDRARRQEIKKETVKGTVQWLLAAVLGGAGTWISLHWGGGGK